MSDPLRLRHSLECRLSPAPLLAHVRISLLHPLLGMSRNGLGRQQTSDGPDSHGANERRGIVEQAHRLPGQSDIARVSNGDDPAFRARFSGTPIKRTGRDRFIRNVLVAIGNAGDVGLAGEAVRLLDDASPLVRAMAVWAVGRLLPPETVARHAEGRMESEADPDVREEWRRATAAVGAVA